MKSNAFICVIITLHVTHIKSQDPWDYDGKPAKASDGVIKDIDVPPDIQMPIKRKDKTDNKLEIGEWFFRRLLAVILRGGQSQQNEDGSVDISLQMKFEPSEWQTLETFLKSQSSLSDDMLRKTMGYVQDSIYKPTITEKIVMAWSDYVHTYLMEYKIYITWGLALLTAAGALFWLWSHMSHKHVILIVFLIFYSYEVIISYKEAEQMELNKFLVALERCKWYFWSSTCELPPPDYLGLLKHMKPHGILVRMITTALMEPVAAISETVGIVLHELTDGLYFPFNKIAYGFLIVTVTISTLYFFIMILINWILNIPFSFGFGLINILQRQRTLITNNNQETSTSKPAIQTQNGEILATLNKFAEVCSLALNNNAQNRAVPNTIPMLTSHSTNVGTIQGLHRSASTGRLPKLSFENSIAIDNIIRRRPHNGSGDAR